MVQFLYLGDVTVPQHRLQAVLAAAQDLQIHQLRLIVSNFVFFARNGLTQLYLAKIL